MNPAGRRLVLATHLASSVGWIGAALGYLALGITAAATEDVETMRAAWIGMDLIGWLVIVPLAITALLTGIVIALGTPWGLFRHYWVVISLALTAFSVAILILHMPAVRSQADAAREAAPDHVLMLGGDVLHPAVGLAVLFVVMVLNIYKPRGMT
ncbi:MAG: DUF2269 family protein, partial [Dehalococcoidia bacterium]